MSKLDSVFEAKPPGALELREQFSTPDQQRQTAMVGMWVFLITEVLLFGALFTAFTVYRISDPQGFDLGSKDMDVLLGSVNTAVLICSSFTMALSVYFAEVGNQKLLNTNIKGATGTGTGTGMGKERSINKGGNNTGTGNNLANSNAGKNITTSNTGAHETRVPY